jgi:hypothetical protein
LVYCVLIMYDFGVDLGRRDVGVSDAWVVKRGVQSPRWKRGSDPRWRSVLSHHVLCNQYFGIVALLEGKWYVLLLHIKLVLFSVGVNILFMVFLRKKKVLLSLIIANAMISRVL